MANFVIQRCSTGCRFDLLAANGQSVASSEVYASEAACRRGIDAVRATAPTAPVEDLSAPEQALPNPKFQLYLDKRGRYRFRLKARNGRIVAVSQAYRTKESCLEGIDSVRKNAAEE